MTDKPARSLAEMAAETASLGGGVACPRCACRHFEVYRTTQGSSSVFRYKACRHCGWKVLTVTESRERIIREVSTPEPAGSGELSSTGKDPFELE